jgi:hypothetical protein
MHTYNNMCNFIFQGGILQKENFEFAFFLLQVFVCSICHSNFFCDTYFLSGRRLDLALENPFLPKNQNIYMHLLN